VTSVPGSVVIGISGSLGKGNRMRRRGSASVWRLGDESEGMAVGNGGRSSVEGSGIEDEMSPFHVAVVVAWTEESSGRGVSILSQRA
jgi:hypothetical protein